MKIEDRQHQRTQLDFEDADHCFHLEVYDRRYVLNRIHDISVSGTGIQIPDEIEPGTPVKVVFRSGEHVISVNGTTVWCDPISLGKDDDKPLEATYRTGVQFDPKDRNCTLFFMAMRDLIGERQRWVI